MSCYFPIPPNIEVSSIKKQFITSSLTLGGFSNNSLLDHVEKNIQKRYFYSIYILKNSFWEKIDDLKCNYGEFIEVSRSQFGVDSKKFMVAISSERGNNPERCEILPAPYTLRKDISPVAERASYNFKIKNISTSFQGEYPFRMSSIKKGSLITIFKSAINDSSQQKNYVLLMNLKRDSNHNQTHKIYMLDPYSKKLLNIVSANNNSFNVICLNNLINEKYLNTNKEIFIQCKTAAFIPIFINLKNNLDEINVEHTHPPKQFFWHGFHEKETKMFKKKWLGFI